MKTLCMQIDINDHGIHGALSPSAAVLPFRRSSARFSNRTERRLSSLRLSGVPRVRAAAQHTLSRFHRSNERPCIVPTEVYRPQRCVPGSLAENSFSPQSRSGTVFLPHEARRVETCLFLHEKAINKGDVVSEMD